MRDPDRGDAVGERIGVARPVCFKRLAVLVEVPAVELDDQLLVFEVHVYDVAVDEDVGLEAREILGPAELPEGVLELGAGEAVMAFGDVRSQQPGAGVGRVAGQEVDQLRLGQVWRVAGALLMARVSVLRAVLVAMSRRVRAAVVALMPRWVVMSRRVRVRGW